MCLGVQAENNAQHDREVAQLYRCHPGGEEIGFGPSAGRCEICLRFRNSPPLLRLEPQGQDGEQRDLIGDDLGSQGRCVGLGLGLSRLCYLVSLGQEYQGGSYSCVNI